MPRISLRTGRGSRVSMSYTGWVILALVAGLPLIAAALAVYLAWAVVCAVAAAAVWLAARWRASRDASCDEEGPR
jgi:hypothetical protein